MKGSAHLGDKNFRKSKRTLLEGVFSGIFYALPRTGSAMILLKFEDNLEPVKLCFKHNFTTSAGHFCFKRNFL